MAVFSRALRTALPTAALPVMLSATLAWSTIANSQQPAADSTTLTADNAVTTAERNNPDFLQTVTTRRSAAAAVRSAYGALMPQFNASLSGQFQQGGQQFISGASLGANSDAWQSQYFFGLTYQLNSGLFLAPRQQHAQAEAVESDITGARSTLRATVRQQYLSALQSEARVRLQDTLVANAQLQVDLARARASVGSGTGLDVQRAEVAFGQQRVQQLQARNQLQVDKLHLFQQMGVAPNLNVHLVDNFATDTVVPSLEVLLATARQSNPAVSALRSRERAADIGVKRERSEYLPTLTLSTGIGGYTYEYRDANYLIGQARSSTDASRASCVALQEARAAAGLPNTLSSCAVIAFDDAQASAIRASNSQFPFSFTTSPKNVSAQFSLPLFDGFAREQRVQEAKVQREDARYARRSRELALDADVTSAYLTLQTASQTVALQTENSAKARQELQFVQDQYGVGLATFVDLTTSRTAYAQAENDRISAQYDYYKAVAALESAIGRPLR